MNPESMSCQISPRDIYRYSKHTNIPWNIPQYQPFRHHQDPSLQVQKRKWQDQKKGQKTDKYVTKRGFYMDYTLKVAKSIPSAADHQEQSPWKFDKMAKLSQHIKVDPKKIKETYIQRIEIQQKARKVPGVSTYRLQKQLKDIETELVKIKQKKHSNGQRRFFYEDTQHLSNLFPGSGQHNPHQVQKTSRTNKTDYKYWIKKHEDTSRVISNRSAVIPGAATYSPMSQSYRTFQQINKSPPNSLSKKNAFGSDSRFPYVRPVLTKHVETKPSPANYNTYILWRGKKSTEKRHWSELNWTGRRSSIYN